MTLSFSDALDGVETGKYSAILRSNWNGKDMLVKLQRPDEHSKMTLPYLYIEYPEGHPAYPEGMRCPWLASQSDLLTHDWYGRYPEEHPPV